MKKQLARKQRLFVEAYEGDAEDAALKAGYAAKTARSSGERLLRDAAVREALKDRGKNRANRTNRRAGAAIATLEKRQAFWSGVMEDEERELRDRLRASELLGKSQGDFLDRSEQSAAAAAPPPDPLAVMAELREQRRERD